MHGAGSGSYNTVVWSPHGRFVCLGGFGNLAGHMAFWDTSLRLQLGAGRPSTRDPKP
jgi:translation initiation factor 2A